MLSGSNKPLQLLPDAEDEKELPDEDGDDTVSDPNDGSRAAGMLYQTGAFVDPHASACLLPSPDQLTIGLARFWLAL